MLGALRVHENALPQAVLFFEAQRHRLDIAVLGNPLQRLLQRDDLIGRILAVTLEVNALQQVGLRQHLGNLLIANAFVHLVEEADKVVQGGHELGKRSAFQHRGAFAVADDQAVGGAFHHDPHELRVVLDVLFELALLDAIQRRLRDVNVASLNEFLHVAEEEREQQRANVRAVHVGVGHQDDLAVAQLRNIEIFFANARAQRGNHGANFFMAKHLVVARFFHVQDLTLQRKNGLKAAVTSLLGGAARALTLDEIDLAAIGVALGTVGQLAGQASAVESTFAASQIAGLARGLASTRGLDRLVDDFLGDRRVLLEESSQALVHECLHGAGDIGIELSLGLAFELRLRQFHAHHRHQTFANVVPGKVLFHVLKQTELLTRIVNGACQRRAKARQVTTAVNRVDVIGEAEHRLGIAVVILQRDLHGYVVTLGFHVDRLVVEHALATIQVLDELGDPAVVLELRALGLPGLLVSGALVGERDEQPFVQERHLA